MNSHDQARHSEALGLVQDLQVKDRAERRAILRQNMHADAEAKLASITTPSSDPDGVIDALAVLNTTRGLTQREEELKKNTTHLLIARDWLALARSVKEGVQQGIQKRLQKV